MARPSYRLALWTRSPCVRSGQLVYDYSREKRAPSKWVRKIYTRHVGPIPAGYHVHHTCGNGWCIEPTHLEALTPRQHREAHRYKGLVRGFDETVFG